MNINSVFLRGLRLCLVAALPGFVGACSETAVKPVPLAGPAQMAYRSTKSIQLDSPGPHQITVTSYAADETSGPDTVKRKHRKVLIHFYLKQNPDDPTHFSPTYDQVDAKP